MADDTAPPIIATRVTMHEAKRHFEAGGAVLVSEYGHEPTQTVTPITTTHDRTHTTWDDLAADVKEWRNRYPNQRFYIVPTVDACTCSTDEDACPDVRAEVAVRSAEFEEQHYGNADESLEAARCAGNLNALRWLESLVTAPIR